MSNARIITFGCRLNSLESEVMRGLVDDAKLGDTVIVNTCAVTAEAERQARQAIRRARRERPGARIVVTGCAAQINAAAFAAMPEVDQVLGNQEKLSAQSFVAEGAPRVAVNDIMSVRETAGHLVAGLEGRARAYLQVQTGCDHRCTFCIIPFGRGNSRSVPLGEVVAQARKLVANGHREIVLTGVDLTAYGADLPGKPTLGACVARLLDAVPALPRLRLSSVDPVEIDETLVDLIGREPRLMPHLHLSVQAGDDMILKRMKRRHTRQDVIALCARLRAVRPEIVFGADLIAGFPTETDEMFENTRRLIDEAGLTWLHVFPYSPRPDTPAARMPQVPVRVRRDRARSLREAGKEAVARFEAQADGTLADILVEKPGMGRSAQFAAVSLQGETIPAGEIISARLEVGPDGLRARSHPGIG